MSSCCCCHCCHCCSCGTSCGCGDDNDQELGGVSLGQFPVYVSYPAFFVGDSAIEGANQAIFIRPDTSTLPGTTNLPRSMGRTARRCRG